MRKEYKHAAVKQRKGKKSKVFLIGIILLVIGALGFYFSKNILLEKMYPLEYYDIVMKESENNDLDPALVYGVICAESGFDENAVSRADARGLMQMTPATFEWMQTVLGESGEYTDDDLFDPDVNIRFGCELLSLLINHYGNESTAVCAYNAGMGNVSSWLENSEYSDDGVVLKEIPFAETREYVKRVTENKSIYKDLYNDKLY